MDEKRGRFVTSKYRASLWKAKQGQVTVFIIIGIIVVFAFAGVLFLTQSSTKDQISASGDPIIADVPQQFSPIQSYTENCLTEVSKRGLRILGSQGGYIHPETLGDFIPTNPTESVGVTLAGAYVPYWHYATSANSDPVIELAGQVPVLKSNEDPATSVEAQLERFVENELESCIQSYAPFTEQGFTVVAEQQKEVTVTVSEQSVGVWLQQDVAANLGDAEITLEQFYVKLPIRLPSYFAVAENITRAEREFQFIERQALDLLATYAGVDSTLLPPKEAVTFERGEVVTWSEEKIKSQIQSLLSSYVPVLRYLGSEDFYRYEYTSQPTAASVIDYGALRQKNYDNMIVPLDDAAGLEVDFDYFDWPLYVDVNDKGGIIGPTVLSRDYLFVHFATQQYYTSYDLSYPVLITLRDPSAFGGEGYTFTFALEANVRNNQPIESGDILPPPVVAQTESMLCDPDKRNTELVRTVVLDAATQSPVEAVQIGLSVPEQDDCLIGTTNSFGTFIGNYPVVVGGIGTYIHEDYLSSFYPINTIDYQESPGIIGYAIGPREEPIVELYPYKTVNVTIQKKNMVKCINNNCPSLGLLGSSSEALYSYTPEATETRYSWHFVNSPQELTPTETAAVTLRRVGGLREGVYEEDFAAAVAVTGSEKTPMRLVPGIYEVTGVLTNEEVVRIPRDERCIDAGVFRADECFTIAEQLLDPFVGGQLAWDEDKYYLTITPEQLYGNDELTLYVLAADEYSVPESQRVVEDLQVIGELASLSKQVQSQLQPRFS